MYFFKFHLISSYGGKNCPFVFVLGCWPFKIIKICQTIFNIWNLGRFCGCGRFINLNLAMDVILMFRKIKISELVTIIAWVSLLVILILYCPTKGRRLRNLFIRFELRSIPDKIILFFGHLLRIFHYFCLLIKDPQILQFIHILNFFNFFSQYSTIFYFLMICQRFQLFCILYF